MSKNLKKRKKKTKFMQKFNKEVLEKKSSIVYD